MLMDAVNLTVQSLVLLILAIHDWIPLGRLNDLAGLKKRISVRENVFITLGNCVPVILAVGFTVWYFDQTPPLGVRIYVFLIYGLMLAGAVRAWWIPYFFGGSPERAERYKDMFGNTHSFLPPRNGIVPNTLHCVLHLGFLLAFIFSGLELIHV